MIVKVCRECGEEYRPDILRCADCGGELEARHEEDREAWPAPGRRRSEAESQDSRPPGDYQPIGFSLLAAELTPLADRLVAAAIPFYLRPRPVDGDRPSGYEIRVRTEERAAALREIEELERAGAPREAAPPAGPWVADASRHCPACGHALAERAVECPDCGLTFGDVREE